MDEPTPGASSSSSAAPAATMDEPTPGTSSSSSTAPAAPAPEDAAKAPVDLAEATAAVVEAKSAGNAALTSADLPLAVEQYESALQLFDVALGASSQPRQLRQNDVVQYTFNDRCGYGVVDLVYESFGDYLINDLGRDDIIKEKLGRYEEAPKRFKRRDLVAVPQDLFDVRLAILQNLALVSLKLARASKRPEDFEDTVHRADAALAMDGLAVKALMRKGAALIELNEVDFAAQVLVTAAKQTRGKDPEVQRLLRVVLQAKGKGKGRMKGKAMKNNPNAPKDLPPPCTSCGDQHCVDPCCGIPPSREGSSDSEDERIGLSGLGTVTGKRKVLDGVVVPESDEDACRSCLSVSEEQAASQKPPASQAPVVGKATDDDAKIAQLWKECQRSDDAEPTKSDAPAASKFSVGQNVECRDRSGQWLWGPGIVTSLAPLMVKKDGQTQACTWDEVRVLPQCDEPSSSRVPQSAAGKAIKGNARAAAKGDAGETIFWTIMIIVVLGTVGLVAGGAAYALMNQPNAAFEGDL